MLFDKAWDLMKADIFHEGRAYESMDDLMPILNEQIENWGGSNKKLSPFPFPFRSGKYRNKSWQNMLDYGLDDFITRNPGFQSSDEMLPAMMPWVGGKTQIQPFIRGLADFFPDARPAEMYGGSGSTILGLNRGTGFYNDINPDNTNAFTHLKEGLGVIEIPKTKERMNEMISNMNEMRFRRDVLGEQLSNDELRELASQYIATNHQAFGNLKYPQSEKQRLQFPEWYSGERYTEGPILDSGWRRSSKRVMPHEVGALDLSAYPNRMRDVEIHTGDLRDNVKLLEGDEFLYLDPQYIDRKTQYGGSNEQQSGVGYDELQRDTVKIGTQHDGPVLYSNYLVGPQSGNPNYEMISDLLDGGFDLHTWMRKPKRNARPVVEVLGLRNFPDHVQLGKRKSLFDYK